jgi:hypothetical protein
MRREGFADCGSESGDDIHDAVRQPDRFARFGEKERV